MIYYYLTFACNLRCLHCYVGDRAAAPTYARPAEVAGDLASRYRTGARQVVFLGGEPTLHPSYERILETAHRIGYTQITVDSNGTSRYPLPASALAQRVTVRLGFDGLEAEHDRIRGTGAFREAIRCLRRIVADGGQAAVTITLHSGNAGAIEDMVSCFAREGIREINFHFVSLVGNGSAHPWLGLTPALVLSAQEQLAGLRRACPIPLRYPQLLVTREGLAVAVRQGLRCRLDHDGVRLILPDRRVLRCPLELAGPPPDGAAGQAPHTFSGCPLGARLLPQGIPDGYAMTCISWKPQEVSQACP